MNPLEMTKELVLRNVCELAGRSLYGCAVGLEAYDDPKKQYAEHFHIYIQTTRKFKWGLNDLDSIAGTHGHYKPVRLTPGKALAYTVKDNNYVKHGCAEFELFFKNSIFKYAYKHVPAYWGDLSSANLPPRNWKIKDGVAEANTVVID